MKITERIIKYLDYKGVTKYKFCKDLGVSTGYLNKSRDISTDTYRNILQYLPEVNPWWLLTGEGEMIQQKQDTHLGAASAVIEIHPESKANTLLADVKAAAGIGSLLQDHRKLEELPSISLPNAPFGLNIAFQIDGDSMHPTIRHLDYVAANKIEDRANIISGYVYILVDKDYGVVCKRVYKKGDALTVESDNPKYPPYTREYDQLYGVFRAFCRFSTDFRNYHDDVRLRIAEHERRLVSLENTLGKHK